MLQFSPRNKLLHTSITNTLCDNFLGKGDYLNNIARIIIHHVTCKEGNGYMQIEYEVWKVDGKIEFGRVRLI